MQGQTSGYCENCSGKVLAVKDKINHTLHLILTIFTMGLWLWVWPVLWYLNVKKPYLCTKCGSAVFAKGEA